jgi:leader peptidase (prepilin peptidase)/N-methyltransferase
MYTTLAIIFFLLGIVIGSFLNVVIFRLNTNKSFGGRSICLSCRNQICWHDIIPVFSFCFLGGRCRHCKTRLSWQYPIVEFITGIVFLLLFWKFYYLFEIVPMTFAFTYGYFAAIFAILIIITFYDIRHKIIPDSLSLIFGLLSFFSVFLFSDFILNLHVPSLNEFSGILLSLPFAFLWFVSSGRWMGFGDAKLAIGIGLLLGFSKGLTAIMFAFWIGAIVGILLILLSKIKGMKSEMPFAPFLILGTLIVFILEITLFNLNVF